MAILPISQELADKLKEVARQQNRPLEELLNTIIQQFEKPELLVYHTIEEHPAYQAAQRRVRKGIYARARRYWQQVGDQARLALTDEQLDEQFWYIDPDGIPRLKSDQGDITLPQDPLLDMAEATWQRAQDEGTTHLVGTEHVDTRRILETEFVDHLLRYTHDKHAKPATD